MKIAIITLTFPPEPAQHILDLALGLVAKGHSVKVITSLPSYPLGRIYPSYRWRLISIEDVQGVKVVRLPVVPTHARAFVKRAVYYLTNALSTTLYSIATLFSRADVTVVYHPPLTTALPALMLRLLTGSRFVHWIHDMWPETLEAGGVRNRRLLGYIDRFAKFTYARASKIIVLSNGFKENLIAKGVPHQKIHAIPNWANADTFSVGAAAPGDFERVGLDAGRFHVLYAGNLGEMQALESVVDAVSVVEEEQECVLLLPGTGTREAALRRYVADRGLNQRVKFLGRVSPDQVAAYYSLANALLVHIKDTKLFEITIPHKIYEYMLAAKPIIAAIKGEAAREVSDARAGIVCEPENAASIAQAMRAIRSLSDAEKLVLGANGRRFVLEQRSPRVLIDSIEHVLLEAAGKV
jgi:glycosyltransferase involved in cell wall biosynthesis